MLYKTDLVVIMNKAHGDKRKQKSTDSTSIRLITSIVVLLINTNSSKHAVALSCI